MKITDDQISFDAADFDGMSDFARKALAAYVGERLEFQNVLADNLNATVESAKQSLAEKIRSGEDVVLVLKTLAAVDSAKYDEALTAINTVLGLPVAAPEPAPEPTPVVAEPEKSELVDESLWTKLTSIFK